MKRLIALRKLKRTCILCDKGFMKGEVYYRNRTIYEDYGEVSASEYIMCPRCRYNIEDRKERFERYKPNCKHPIVEMEWHYVAGETFMEPYGDLCKVCNTFV